MGMAVRKEFRVPLPAGFDPDRADHERALLDLISKKHGSGFAITRVDREAGVAWVSREATLVEVTQDKDGRVHVNLPRNAKVSDGDRYAARFAEQYEGFQMVDFRPHLRRATLERMDEPTVRCRSAVAGVLGVKDWEVYCAPRPGGGFSLTLPPRYMPSRHDAKLGEVADSVVGAPGWYVEIDAKRLRGAIIPGEPPMFPEVLPFPMDRLGKGGADRTTIGQALPSAGRKSGPEVNIDWAASAFALVAGTPGSGKSVLLNVIVADAIASGCELVVVDDVSKAIDFEPFRKYCRPGGWGCDSLGGAVAALELVREEGARRARVLKQMGINNWLDMPQSDRFKPILVVVDEVSALLVPDPAMKGVPKDHPLAVEVTERNLLRAMLQRAITRILSELRFVGVRMVLSTQATNANTGVPPSMRTKIGHLLLQGLKPSRSARSQIFADEAGTPTVPPHIQAAGDNARGVGVCTLEGQPPMIYKTFYASPAQHEAALARLGVPTVAHPEPTREQIDRFVPTLGDDGTPDRSVGTEPRKMRNTGAGSEWMTDPETGERLTGFAKANAARHAGAQFS